MYGGWGGSGWMTLMPLLWIVLIGTIVWAVVALTRWPSDRTAPQSGRETPQEILDRRFASGEIDGDAYRQARDQLASGQRGSS